MKVQSIAFKSDNLLDQAKSKISPNSIATNQITSDKVEASKNKQKNNTKKQVVIGLGAVVVIIALIKHKYIGEFFTKLFRKKEKTTSIIEEPTLSRENLTVDIQSVNEKLSGIKTIPISENISSSKIDNEVTNIIKEADSQNALTEVPTPREKIILTNEKLKINYVEDIPLKRQSKAYLFGEEYVGPDNYGTFFEKNMYKRPVSFPTWAGECSRVNLSMPKYLYHITSSNCAANILKEQKLNKANYGIIKGIYAFDIGNLLLNQGRTNSSFAKYGKISYGDSLLRWYSMPEFNPNANGKISIIRIPTENLKDKIVVKPMNSNIEPQNLRNVFSLDYETDLLEYIIKEDKFLDLASNNISVIDTININGLTASEFFTWLGRKTGKLFEQLPSLNSN